MPNKLPSPFFAHMRPSEHAESIYYADMFRINGKVWLLTGSGKTIAGTKATGHVQEDCLGQDSIALIRDGAQLLARKDHGALNPEMIESEHPLHTIAAVAYCMSEEETTKAYAGRSLDIEEGADALTFGLLLTKSMYPATLAPHFFDDAEMLSLNDPNRRFNRWMELMDGVTGVRLLIVPYMPTVEAKAALYTSLQV